MASIRVEDLTLTYPVRGNATLATRARPVPASRRIEGDGRRRFVTALRDVSFSLGAGDRLGIVGGNGSGKTTLLKVLYGIHQPTHGVVAINGRVDALFNINLGFRREATGRRNIELRGLINGWSKAEMAERMENIIAFSELGDFIDLPLKTYSQGMAARLAFSVATALRPDILLMDEWIAAGDERFRQKAQLRLTEMTKEAAIVVLATHDRSLLARFCNKLLELEEGRVKTLRDVVAEAPATVSVPL